MNGHLIDEAYRLLKTNPKYLADARRGTLVNNTVISALLAMQNDCPRWASEAAVKTALLQIRIDEMKGEREGGKR